MSSQQCPCAELDWRDVDQTQTHHPDCKAKTTVNISVTVHGSLIHESQLRDVIRSAVWRTIRVSTSLYRNISTSEAVNLLLDKLKWPADKRRIDKGKVTLDSWFVVNESAFKVISELVAAEGPHASFYEDENGNLVFETGGN